MSNKTSDKNVSNDIKILNKFCKYEDAKDKMCRCCETIEFWKDAKKDKNFKLFAKIAVYCWKGGKRRIKGEEYFNYTTRAYDLKYCPSCRKEVRRVNEEEIRKRIEVLEARENGYLEVGNTRQANKIRNEIYKWEALLERINGSLEKKVEKLEYFIKSKDLWESYLHF